MENKITNKECLWELCDNLENKNVWVIRAHEYHSSENFPNLKKDTIVQLENLKIINQKNTSKYGSRHPKKLLQI